MCLYIMLVLIFCSSSILELTELVIRFSHIPIQTTSMKILITFCILFCAIGKWSMLGFVKIKCIMNNLRQICNLSTIFCDTIKYTRITLHVHCLIYPSIIIIYNRLGYYSIHLQIIRSHGLENLNEFLTNVSKVAYSSVL